MLEQTYILGQAWNAFREPSFPAYTPTGSMLLLSALNKGWQITHIELAPSWDQHGFIYQVTLRYPANKYSQQIILPKNPMIEDLLSEAGRVFPQP
jgi:hypothetical protein